MLISLIINNYNYAQFLEECILSALSQSYDSLEVIVVDDGSIDNSRNLIESYKDQVVSIFKPNGGQASAFNEGFRASKGEIVCFLDSDDYFFPDKISKIAQFYDLYPDAGWCFHELEEIDKFGGILKRRRKRVTELEYLDLKPVFLAEKEFEHWFPATSGLSFRREILKDILPMPEAFTVSADSFLRLAAFFISPGVLVPELLAVHRQHGNNLYEFRDDVALKRAEIAIKSSYYLRQKFPETRLYSNYLFCRSVCKLAEHKSLMEMWKIFELKEFVDNEKSLIFRAKLAAYILKGAFGKK